MASLSPDPSTSRQTAALVGSHAASTSRRIGRPRWTLPGEARLIITCGTSHVGAAIGNRHYDRLPHIAIVGPTSRPRTSWSDGAPPVEIPLTALDWCGLGEVSADAIADRIVTPDQVGMTVFANGLVGQLDAARDDGHIAQITRAVVETQVRQGSSSMAPHVEALMQIVDETLLVDAAEVATRIGIAPHVLRRVALKQFGFPAKTLLTRRRFLRALDVFRSTNMDMTAAVACGYFDSSHFLRDAKRFIGMTPRRFFTALDQPA